MSKKRKIEKGYEVKAAVESTGNTWYFRNKLLTNGIEVIVVNTLKFKVVNESVKKTEKHNSSLTGEYQESDSWDAAWLWNRDKTRIAADKKKKGSASYRGSKTISVSETLPVQ